MLRFCHNPCESRQRNSSCHRFDHQFPSDCSSFCGNCNVCCNRLSKLDVYGFGVECYQNISIGANALQNTTSGFSNTAIGTGAGKTLTTGSNVTCIGFNAQPSSSTASNEIILGDANVKFLRCNVQNISALSDQRDKADIEDLNVGLDLINKIKPAKYHWDRREWYPDGNKDGSQKKAEWTAGFIAQNLAEAQQGEEFLNLANTTNPDKFEITPGNLIPVLVRAVQELSAKNDDLDKKLSDAMRMIEALQNK
jgi:hypothetical protein